MSTTPQPAQTEATRALRVFRACGVAPLGVFVVLHVLGYAQVLLGRRVFGDPDQLQLPWWELAATLVLVVLPLGYHAGYGLYLLTRRTRTRASRSATVSLLDGVQRWTSLPLLAYVADHFIRFRLPIVSGALSSADAYALLVRELSSAPFGLPLVAAFQLLGLAALAFHLGYGLYRQEWQHVAWLRSEPRRARLSTALALLVLLAGSFAIIQLATGKTLPFL